MNGDLKKVGRIFRAQWLRLKNHNTDRAAPEEKLAGYTLGTLLPPVAELALPEIALQGPP